MQHDLFAAFDLVPTPAMEKGEGFVWQCHWCGTLIATAKDGKPDTCPCCRHEDCSWSKVERAAWGVHYAGPFYAKAPGVIAAAVCEMLRGQFGVVTTDAGWSKVRGEVEYIAEQILEIEVTP